MQFIHCSNMYGLNMFIKLVLKNIQKHLSNNLINRQNNHQAQHLQKVFNRLNLLKNSKPEYYLLQLYKLFTRFSKQNLSQEVNHHKKLTLSGMDWIAMDSTESNDSSLFVDEFINQIMLYHYSIRQRCIKVYLIRIICNIQIKISMKHDSLHTFTII